MNNTHVYSLRRTPVGYNGPTSMYDGTRIISISNEPHMGSREKKENVRREHKTAARSPYLKQPSPQRPGRGSAKNEGGARYKQSAQEQRRSSQAQTNGRRPTSQNAVSMPYADSFYRNTRTSSSWQDPKTAQAQRKPSPQAVQSQGRPVQGNRRVLSRSQAGTGDFTAGADVMTGHRIATGAVQASGRKEQPRGAVTRERGRPQQVNSAGARPGHDRQPQYDTHTHAGAQPGRNMRGGYNTQNIQHSRDTLGYDRARNEGTARISGVRDARGDIYRTGQMRVNEHDGISRTASEKSMRGGANYATAYGTSGGYARSDRQPQADAYNKNPMYCYGNRSSVENESGRHSSPGARDMRNQPTRKSAPKPKPKPKKKKLTPEEKSRMRAADAARKKAEKQIAFERRKKKKAQNKVKRGTRRVQRRAAAKEFRSELIRALVRSVPFIVLFFITFAIFAGLFVVSVFAALHINISGLPDTVRYQIGENEAKDKITFDLPTDRFIREGVIYMSMDDFAERFEYTVAGNSKELKYISRTSDDIVEVTIGSSAAVVNDVSLRLTAPIVRDGDEILIPLDFFATYVTGFSVSYDAEEHKVTMIREITDYKVSVAEGKTPIYSGADFKPEIVSAVQNIAEGSLPSDILAATDPNPPPPRNR